VYRGRHITIVVPAYCEERLVGRTLEAMPEWVDHVVVVDDASSDGTGQQAKRVGDRRVVVIRHAENRGVGAAIVTGVQAALATGTDVIGVMAADGQMDPVDLPALLDPVVDGRAHYAKGNRFIHAARRDMPRARRIAGRALAVATRLATGLGIDDSQCGYTALSAAAARMLPLETLWPRYGYPNDLLGMLAHHRLEVTEVPVRPVYANEKSGVRPWHFGVVLWVIARRWAKDRTIGAAPKVATPAAIDQGHGTAVPFAR